MPKEEKKLIPCIWNLWHVWSHHNVVCSASMAELDQESEELHQKFLEKDIDLPTFVQKYKKLRTAYHKQALLHLAGQTSLRWCPWAVALDGRSVTNSVVFLLTQFLLYALLGPVFWVQLIVGPLTKHETEFACIVVSWETFYLYAVLPSEQVGLACGDQTVKPVA